MVATEVGYKKVTIIEKLFKNINLLGKGETQDVGAVKLTARGHMLGEVRIKADVTPIVVRRDTIEFSAEAFKTAPNAVVEELLKRLPGIQVDMDGTINYNGKKVKKLLIDGKQFFANDPRIASKNLDASLIDKVQVYDDRDNDPDHLIPDSKVEKIVNLKFKKALKKSTFGKVRAGGGTRDRFDGGLLYNMFRDTLQISVIGIGNNLNRTGFSTGNLNSMGGFNRSGSDNVYNGTIARGGNSPELTYRHKQINIAATMKYGDLTGSTTEYGNLAYAPVTIGNSAGTVTTKRIAFFLYYKIVDETGKQLPEHAADVFGVGPSRGVTFSAIVSPLNGFTLPANVTSGFKLAKLPAANFNSTGSFITGLLTLGLVPDDLTSSSGFVMHPLSFNNTGGYSPNIPATITYGNTSVSAHILFDTGNPSVSIIENSKETRALGRLPANTEVTVTTNRGFVYKYTTNSTGNLTEIQNPNISGDFRTILSLDFFINNQHLTDYTNHQIGLKN